MTEFGEKPMGNDCQSRSKCKPLSPLQKHLNHSLTLPPFYEILVKMNNFHLKHCQTPMLYNENCHSKYQDGHVEIANISFTVQGHNTDIVIKSGYSKQSYPTQSLIYSIGYGLLPDRKSVV